MTELESCCGKLREHDSFRAGHDLSQSSNVQNFASRAGHSEFLQYLKMIGNVLSNRVSDIAILLASNLCFKIPLM